jgi:transcriptional regulator with XRE-family HTH domain
LNKEEFRKYLKELRLERNLTLEQVELKSGVSNGYLSQVENGKRGIPSAKVLKKLAPVYKISPDELLKAAGIIEVDEFVYTPPKDLSPLESFVRELSNMSKDEQYDTMKELFKLIAEDKPKKGKK